MTTERINIDEDDGAHALVEDVMRRVVEDLTGQDELVENKTEVDSDPINDALTLDIRIPDALQRELTTMRRVPDGYSVVKMVKCSLGCGKGKAYSLTHPDSENAGTWCAVHGWLFFDSVALPSTERLRTWEIEERRLSEQRKTAVARRREVRQ